MERQRYQPTSRMCLAWGLGRGSGLKPSLARQALERLCPLSLDRMICGCTRSLRPRRSGPDAWLEREICHIAQLVDTGCEYIQEYIFRSKLVLPHEPTLDLRSPSGASNPNMKIHKQVDVQDIVILATFVASPSRIQRQSVILNDFGILSLDDVTNVPKFNHAKSPELIMWGRTYFFNKSILSRLDTDKHSSSLCQYPLRRRLRPASHTQDSKSRKAYRSHLGRDSSLRASSQVGIGDNRCALDTHRPPC